MRAWPLVAAAGLALAGSAGGYLGLVTGRLTVDLGVGRRERPLGPITVDVAAPPKAVYAAAAAPYAARRPRALREKVQIWERGDGMVLAAHRTPVSDRLTAVTVETVTLEPPERMTFRLLRGPVPYVTETFTFTATARGTRLTYEGTLGTDLWALGAAWGDLVARNWVAAVQEALETIRSESERGSD